MRENAPNREETCTELIHNTEHLPEEILQGYGKEVKVPVISNVKSSLNLPW
jgi:hypothetical protein